MSYFMQRGNIFQLTDEKSVSIHRNLPKGLYEVLVSDQIGFYLQPREPKDIPSKLYGSVMSRANRIIRTYEERQTKGLATGVLLSGEKGSGKTLLARAICASLDIPTVTVSEPYTHPDFLKLLTAGGRKIVLFDEFEKVYHKQEDQNALLSMLDGQYETQNLTIATVNETYGLSKALQNRPSRFYYHYQYATLDDAFVEEYCKDNLRNFSERTLHEIRQVVMKVWGFNFDMLQALVEEMNRFGDTPAETIKHINIIPETFSHSYTVVVTDLAGNPAANVKEKELKLNSTDPHYISFHVTLTKKGKKNSDEAMDYVYMDKDDLVSNDYGTLTYENKGIRVVLTPVISSYSQRYAA